MAAGATARRVTTRRQLRVGAPDMVMHSTSGMRSPCIGLRVWYMENARRDASA